MVRRGKEGRVLWAATCHRIPCFEIVKFWRSEGMKILVLLAPKGHLWKNGSSWDFSLERAMLWYCGWRLLLGKSTFSIVWFNVELIVQNRDGDVCLNCSSYYVVLPPGQFSSFPWSPWCIEVIEKDPLLRAKKIIQIMLQFYVKIYF